MPLVATRGGASAFGLGWSAAGAAEELGGMVLLKPTSIAYSGTSASIGTNGSVEFSACTSLSLNGVFSADYENYLLVSRCFFDSASYNTIRVRLRSSGSDNSTNSSYTTQSIEATSTTITGIRNTPLIGGYGQLAAVSNVKSGFSTNIYGPFLTQPTAFRTVGMYGRDNARILDAAITHNQSTSYDGITLYETSDSFSGLVSVFGLVGA